MAGSEDTEVMDKERRMNPMLTYFRCPVESADKVGGDVVIPDEAGRTKVTDLQNQFSIIHLQNNNNNNNVDIILETVTLCNNIQHLPECYQV